MSDHPEPQPQLTAGDQLELELRSRLVKLERGQRTLAALCSATAILVLVLLIKDRLT